MDTQKLEERVSAIIGTKINNITHYVRAFTHKSALNRYPNLTQSYETLEFLGDSVLDFIITKFLFDKYGSEEEGFLTKMRVKMVCGTKLCEISKMLGLDQLIIMDEKAERYSWNTNMRMMEDVFEALIGAIYVDLGLLHAKRFVLDTYSKVEISTIDENYKDQLMRWCQASKVPLPVYNVVSHDKGIFGIQLVLNGVACGIGYATTKKQGEQHVAEMILKTDKRFNPDAFRARD